MLKVYNSLTRKKEKFVPLKEKEVGMYVCGITAYDSCHLGHARAAVAFDVVYRYLRFLGFKITYVRNYTDIDDKIIHRSKELNIPWNEITERYIKEYQEDMKQLHVLPPTKEPRATEHIPHMIKVIQKLIDNKMAYESQAGVYYSVRAFKNYGKLSHKNIEDLESGARIEIDETKKDPLDFALWKRAKPGEPEWESPWGKGRPGWHIECSVMSTDYLGQPFDIHGGGRDLIFPHHENEIAQAEGCLHKPFCRYFLHNGFVNIDAEKMSKSKKNFKTIREVVAEHDAEVVRFFLISAHYGSPIDFTGKNMQDARAALDRYYMLAQRMDKGPWTMDHGPKAKITKPESKIEKELAGSLKELPKRFKESMDEDFNTAGALGAVFETIRFFNKYLDGLEEKTSPFYLWANSEWKKHQKEFQDVLGVFVSDPKDYFSRLKESKAKIQSIDTAWIEEKIDERRRARIAKNFKLGDAIREELLKMGVEIKDKPDGTTEWHLR